MLECVGPHSIHSNFFDVHSCIVLGAAFSIHSIIISNLLNTSYYYTPKCKLNYTATPLFMKFDAALAVNIENISIHIFTVIKITHTKTIGNNEYEQNDSDDGQL